ncbi:FAD-dependent monooxygenase [Flavobacterium album]|nr:FAD-dependent monooxygenase [Flavobacterium album]
MEKTTKVIIAGAGPTGLALACQLLRYGIDLIILDKNESTTYLSKAMVVHARTLEIFDEMGLADKAVAEGQIAQQFTILSHGKTQGQMKIGAFGKGLSPFPFALILEQSKTEQLLAKHLSELGTNVQWKSEIVRFDNTGDGVTVFYKDGQGNEQVIKGDYLVGCDGAASPVRHQIGLTFEGDTQERTFFVADVKMESPLTEDKDAWFVMIEKGFVLFFPMAGEKHYRVIGSVPEDLAKRGKATFADIATDLISQAEIPLEFPEEYWFSTYRVHSRMVESFSKGRCFIAGDAAHIHTPAGGQGMNTGIQDAYNLGWKLAFVLQGKANARLLDTYDEERRTNAVNLLKTTDRMFDILAGTSWLTNIFRLYLFPKLIKFATETPFINKRIFPTLSQIGISYPDSPLTIESSLGKTEAGDRMPWFMINGESIYDKLMEPAYKLLYFGNENVAEVTSSVPLSKLSFSEIPDPFESHSDFYIVLRPDNYIAYIGKDLTKVEKALKLM